MPASGSYPAAPHQRVVSCVAPQLERTRSRLLPAARRIRAVGPPANGPDDANADGMHAELMEYGVVTVATRRVGQRDLG